ncbi:MULTISPECIES: alpha/beta hydrolase [Kitasatospora]|uniref:Alpha/beta hydrolase n=1 Tax=Kitasatospora cystarginea TaxID=58350 RepID=A0ABN3DK25_9ACTN
MTATTRAADAAGGGAGDDIRYGSLRYGGSAWHRVDLYLPAGAPARNRIVLLHGGFWRHDRVARDLRPLATALVGRGRAVAAVEYRPLWDGGAWPGAVQDALAADVALRALDPAWADALLVGHSAGAQLALGMAAGHAERRRLLLLAPVADLVAASELGVGAGAVEQYLADHLAAGGTAGQATPAPDPRDLAGLDVVSAAEDQAVPAELTHRQLDRWRSAGLPLRHTEVPGARHMHLVNPQRPGCAVVLDLMSALGTAKGDS